MIEAHAELAWKNTEYLVEKRKVYNVLIFKYWIKRYPAAKEAWHCNPCKEEAENKQKMFSKDTEETGSWTQVERSASDMTESPSVYQG